MSDYVSSSSFGDAVDLFYFVDKHGDLYKLKNDVDNVISSLVFKNFSAIDYPPYGVAITEFTRNESSSSSEIMTSSLSSISSQSSVTYVSSSLEETSSSSISSESSKSSLSSSSSEIKYDYNVYILRKKDSATVNLSVYDISGYLKVSMDFTSGVQFRGLSPWPDSNNILVGISEHNIHMLYISSGQVGIYSFASPISLTYGISFQEKVDDNKTDFLVRRKDKKQMVILRIDKRYRTASVVREYSVDFHRWDRIGGVVFKPDVFFLIKETGVAYSVIEQKQGHSRLYITGFFDESSSNVSSSSSNSAQYEYTQTIGDLPFSVYGVTSPVSGGAMSLSAGSVSVKPVLYFNKYDSDGNFSETFNSLFMGNMQPGKKSSTTIINMRISGASSISDIKLGIIEADIGGDVDDIVMYGVSDVIDPDFVVEDYFPGINESQTADDANNITIGLQTDELMESKYVYLAIDVPKRYTGRGYLVFKWFFNYE